MRRSVAERRPFKTYTQVARHLREGALLLPRPPTCLFCGRDCGFVKDGHYFRDFVFLAVVLTHVAVQRYLCKQANSTFSALASFQEPRAHYAVHVRGAVLESVFALGRSRRRTWRLLSKDPGGKFLSRSTVGAWCGRFQDRVPDHAAALALAIGGAFPANAAKFLVAARVAFESSKNRPRTTFWEWLESLLRTENRHLLSA